MGFPANLARLARFLTAGSNGDLTATNTPAQFDASKLLATMEAVQRALGNHRDHISISGATALSSDHVGAVVHMQGATNYAVTLPPLAGLPDGATVTLYANSTTNTRTIQAPAGATITAWGNTLGSFTVQNEGAMVFVKANTEWRLMDGALALPYSSLFKNVISNSGYQKLPGGIILQWGFVSGGPASGATSTVTFPLAFPNGVLVAIPVANSSGACYLTVLNYSATTFQIKNSSAVAAANSFWIAIGY